MASFYPDLHESALALLVEAREKAALPKKPCHLVRSGRDVRPRPAEILDVYYARQPPVEWAGLVTKR
jgi:hypothetical protein